MSVNEDSEAISFEVEDFEVLDECLEDDEEENEQTQVPEELKSQSENDDSEVKPSVDDIETSDKNDIDFTADISLDDNYVEQVVINHLSEIETIVLDVQSFGLEVEDENVKNKDQQDEPDVILLEPDKSDDLEIVLEEENKEKIQEKKDVDDHQNEWYGEKLKSKAKVAKDRLAKLARVLEISYPSYKPWITHQKTLHDSLICKFDNPRGCSLDRPHTNRWKFKCVRKPFDETSVGKTEETTGKNEEKNEKDNDDNIEDETNDQQKNEENDENEVEEVNDVEDMKGINEHDESQDEKNADNSVWKMIPCGDSGGNANGTMLMNPPYVIHAVKIFEDFINRSEAKEEDKDGKAKKGEKNNVDSEFWASLLVRSNSKDELMLFATGRFVSQARMEAMKQLYESGEGKDCKVKSLYCKTSSKVHHVSTCQTIFLYGTEALEETVGNLKIQLAPKTNFWSNTIGAVELGKTVEEFIAATPKMTIVEIGCGVGLMGLMLAPKCQRVIGLDLQSEVEEAEMTCELNNIKNASFISGDTSDVLKTIAKACASSQTAAIINANTIIGRKVEVMWGLRKMQSMRKLVMITTLTKPSIRSVLELANPSPEYLSQPFVPTRAIVVDTLPMSQHFEVVILMERKPLRKIMNPKGINSLAKSIPSTVTPKTPKSDKQAAKSRNGAVLRRSAVTKAVSTTKKPGKFSGKLPPGGKVLVKNPYHDNAQGKQLGKGKKSAQRPQPPQSNSRKPLKRRHDSEPFRTNAKQARSDLNDLRCRLSQGRYQEPDLIQQVRDQQRILQLAKEKLSGSSIEPGTVRQVHEMLDLALEHERQIQNHLPRSVWDRIAPADDNYRDFPLRGSLVQERGSQNIVITTPNAQFQGAPVKCNNEPVPLMPTSFTLERKERGRNRAKPHERNQWNAGSRSSERRERSPPRRLPSPRREFSPRRDQSPFMGPRGPSPQRLQQDRDFEQRLSLDIVHRNEFSRRQLSPMRRNLPSPMGLMSPTLGGNHVSFADDWDLPIRGSAEMQSGWMRSERNSNWNPQGSDDLNRTEDLPRLCNDLPRLGSDLPRLGSDLPRLGSDLPRLGSDFSRLGSDLPRLDSDLSRLGSEFSRGGNDMPRICGELRAKNEGFFSRGLENRWIQGQSGGSGDNNWNNRSSGPSKEDWNDLPEDARDPWDDPNKDRRLLSQGCLGNFRNQDRNEGQGWSGMNEQRWQNSQGNQNWRQNSGSFNAGFQGRGFGNFGDRR